jgi:hypothetical protein
MAVKGKTGLWHLSEAIGARNEAWGPTVWRGDGKRRKLGWWWRKIAIRVSGRSFYRARSTHSCRGLSLSLGGVGLNRDKQI